MSLLAKTQSTDVANGSSASATFTRMAARSTERPKYAGTNFGRLLPKTGQVTTLVRMLVRVGRNKTRLCHFTSEILEEMAGNGEGRKNAGISVTTCTGCARQGYYNLALDYHQYPHNLWPATRGTAFHLMMERHPQEGAIYERRFRRQLPSGVWLTGQIDKLVPSEQIIMDYKSKDKVPEEIPQDYVFQINGYRWLVADGTDMTTGERVSYPITRLGLIWLTMLNVRKTLVPLKTDEEVVAYFGMQATSIQRALDGGEIPPRAYNPELSSFCRSWCGFHDRCTCDGM